MEHNRNSTNDIDNCGDSTTEQNSIEGNEDESYKEDFIDICNNTIGQEPSDESGGVNKSTTNIIFKRRLSDSIEDIHSNCGHQTGKVKKQKPNRNCRSCPIKGCTASNLVKLSQHLLQTHKIIDKAKRFKILEKACKVLICIRNHALKIQYVNE